MQSSFHEDIGFSGVHAATWAYSMRSGMMTSSNTRSSVSGQFNQSCGPHTVLWEELCLPQQAVNILQQRCFTVLMTLYHRKFEAPCAASRSHMLSRFLGPVQLNPPKGMYPILYPRVCYVKEEVMGWIRHEPTEDINLN